MKPLLPTAPSNRIEVLDLLRGFALTGILFVNLTWFTGFAVMSPDEKGRLATAAGDKVVYWLIQVFVDGKFWSLFAFLFGVGVALQYSKAGRSKTRFARLHLRRSMALLLIGLMHGIFLWFGDIVSLYAVAGLVLLVFCQRSDRLALIWAVVFLLIPIAQSGVLFGIHSFRTATAGTDPGYGPAMLIHFFGDGSLSEVFHANWQFLKERWVIAVYDGRFPKLCGMFLLGWWAGRKRLFDDSLVHRRFLWRVFLTGCLIGLPANLYASTAFSGVSLRPPSLDGWILESIKAIGLPALCLAYVAGIGLIYPSIRHHRMTGWFSITGRMSLTNYVSQSLLGIFLFYGIGMGFWGRLGSTASLAVVLLIFVIQVLASRCWLTFFRQGPLEWLCRCFTYGRLLPLVKNEVLVFQTNRSERDIDERNA